MHDILRAGSLDEFASAAAAHPQITCEAETEPARAAIADTIACMIAGQSDPATQAVLRALPAGTAGLSSVLGHAQKLSAEQAAMVNGTAAHALDFDDNFLPAVTHASAVLVPALLALGEETAATGADLIDAYVIGLEVQAWLGRRMNPDHYRAGWHATSTIGAIGAAAACARLLRLGDEPFRNSLSIACSLAGGSKIQFGTMTKPLHAGLAARSGILAANLGHAGVEANPDPIFSEWGFIHHHHGHGRTDLPVPHALSIALDGLAQKRFPCCGSAHRTLDAIIEIRAREGFAVNDVDRVETVIPDTNYRNLRFENPQNEKEARFSMTYCATLALQYGEVRLADFTPEAIWRPELRATMQHIKMREAKKTSSAETDIWNRPAYTCVQLKSGTRFEMNVLNPVGTISVPFTPEQEVTKFQDCIGSRLSADLLKELHATLNNLSGQEIRDLMALLVPQ
ncbi:MmgE/PrpD family protein [uncultured Ruegeria sp.]|uniref:MmgE/PrpD family protein n=1 Tax=uncultured Ruegeria sp. TaxID=259304 RepID=UPI0026115058|nr:MmgE/PrpD family protein [uncultured Ruegeria sp.]